MVIFHSFLNVYQRVHHGWLVDGPGFVWKVKGTPKSHGETHHVPLYKPWPCVRKKAQFSDTIISHIYNISNSTTWKYGSSFKWIYIYIYKHYITVVIGAPYPNLCSICSTLVGQLSAVVSCCFQNGKGQIPTLLVISYSKPKMRCPSNLRIVLHISSYIFLF